MLRMNDNTSNVSQTQLISCRHESSPYIVFSDHQVAFPCVSSIFLAAWTSSPRLFPAALFFCGSSENQICPLAMVWITSKMAEPQTTKTKRASMYGPTGDSSSSVFLTDCKDKCKCTGEIFKNCLCVLPKNQLIIPWSLMYSQ